MPGSVSVWSFLGSIKGVGPWIGVLAIAFYVGSDHASITNRLDNLARTDTVNMVTIHQDLRELRRGIDTLTARQQRITCYLIQNRGPECAK